MDKKNSKKQVPKNRNKNSSYKGRANVETNKSNKKLVKPKSLLICMLCSFIVLILLLFRLALLQFMQGSELKESASRQQTTNRIISAKRGNIYDSTGKLLAASASVDTVSINPSKIKNNVKVEDKADKEKEEQKLQEKVAKAFSDIFALDYNEMLEKVKSEASIETIIKKVEKDKIDELKEWMKTNKISSGINIDEDVKRYYPYGNLASNLIGFCDTDNNGLEGIERKWNTILSGTAGKMVSIESASSQLIPDSNKSYTPAENGSNITLTIDANIQTIAEKYLKQACIENNCKSGGNVIIMNPSNGDILAMATYPDYDLNFPREPNSTLTATWNNMSETEQLNSLFKMWRNKAVSDTYEPGSTFKIITAAVRSRRKCSKYRYIKRFFLYWP